MILSDMLKEGYSIFIRNNYKTFIVVMSSIIFIDARFKSEAELELVNNLQGPSKGMFCFSYSYADKYLDMLDEFKNLPYYEFDWETEEA